MFMCFKLNSLFDRKMKVYYVTQVLKLCVLTAYSKLEKIKSYLL